MIQTIYWLLCTLLDRQPFWNDVQFSIEKSYASSFMPKVKRTALRAPPKVSKSLALWKVFVLLWTFSGERKIIRRRLILAFHVKTNLVNLSHVNFFIVLLWEEFQGYRLQFLQCSPRIQYCQNCFSVRVVPFWNCFLWLSEMQSQSICSRKHRISSGVLIPCFHCVWLYLFFRLNVLLISLIILIIQSVHAMP